VKTKRQHITLVYEIVMIILAITSVAFIWIDTPSLQFIDKFVWLAFVFDVFIRFISSPKKLEYIKSNPFDLIAIIPFDSIFLLARIARLIRVFRSLIIAFHFAQPFFNIMETNNLERVIKFTFILIFCSSIPVYYVEPGIKTFEDALWWSIVTATTVGYGDFAPVTLLGRSIAVILMFLGIGLIGLLTGAIATYFLNPGKRTENPSIEFIRDGLERIDNLSNEEIDAMILLLQKYKKNNNNLGA